MTRSLSYNIIVAGLGGQGVNTLTRMIFELCEADGRPCGGALFKGGAQKAGTIYSEIRIWAAGIDAANVSNRVLPGSLDLLLGLEPYEALRFSGICSADTQFVVNDVPVRFRPERSGGEPADPVDSLRRRFPRVLARNFTEIAHNDHGDARMASFLMLAEAATSDGFPLGSQRVDEAIRRWRSARASLPSG